MPARDPTWYIVSKRCALVAVLALCGWFGYGWYHGNALAATFSDAQLTALEDQLLRGDPLPLGNGMPPRTGKVLVVVPSTWRRPGGPGYRPYRSSIASGTRAEMERIDPPRLFEGVTDLPAAVRAETLEETATVVFCEPGGMIVGSYVSANGRGSTSAMVRDAMLRAYDRRTGKGLGACHLTGGHLEQIIYTEAKSATPAPDVISAVANMPLVDPAKALDLRTPSTP